MSLPRQPLLPPHVPQVDAHQDQGQADHPITKGSIEKAVEVLQGELKKTKK